MPKSKFLSVLIGLGLSIAMGLICFLICFLMQSNPGIKDSGNQVGIFTASFGLMIVLFLLYISVYFDLHVAFRIIALGLGLLLCLFGALSLTPGALLTKGATIYYGVALMNILPGFVILSEYVFLRRNEEEEFNKEMFIPLSFPISLAVGFVFALIFAIFRNNIFVGGWLQMILYVALIPLIHFIVPKLKMPKFSSKPRQKKEHVKPAKKEKPVKEGKANDESPLDPSFIDVGRLANQSVDIVNKNIKIFEPRYSDAKIDFDIDVGLEDRYSDLKNLHVKKATIIVKFFKNNFYYKIYAEKHLTGEEADTYNSLNREYEAARRDKADLDAWKDNGGDEAMYLERESNAEYNQGHIFTKNNDLNEAYYRNNQAINKALSHSADSQDQILLNRFGADLVRSVMQAAEKIMANYKGVYSRSVDAIVDSLEFDYKAID